MSPDRILAVALDGNWKVENMPFDFNHNTMLRFNEKSGQQLLYEKIINRIKEVDRFSKNENIRFFSKRLVNKNIKSKKFLPDTFLENLEAKDLARCFVSPYKMYPFIYKKIQSLNYDHYNKVLTQKGVKKLFNISLNNWSIDKKIIDIELLQSNTKNVLKFVDENISKLKKEGNDGYIASIKLDRLRNMLDAINKKIMIVTSRAGQGKTNFVCDIASNVLNKNSTPFIFVNAYELSAESLANSIAAEYNFIGNNSLEDVLLKADRFCNQHIQYLIIIIDGLNEHPKQGSFKTNLIRILDATCKHKHIKVLMTCRKEYYENNYLNLQNELKDNLIENKLLPIFQHIHNKETNIDIRLLERYGAYFKTGLPASTSVRMQLLSNMLLMRIFFETYQEQDVSKMSQIDYVSLYQKYFEQQCEKIQQIIEQDAHVENENGIALKIFHHIINWMIKNDVFINLPLEDIQKDMTADERRSFSAFMSANFILQQDSPTENSGQSEVINFTFEEMRDFIVSRYLINEVFAKDKSTFKRLINRYTTESKDQAEGSKRFLFLYARIYKKKNVVKVLKSQKWYNEIFAEYIWELPEDIITINDIHEIKNYLRFHPGHIAIKLVNLHWSPKIFPKLNLNLLLNILKEKNLIERKKYLEETWPSNSGFRIAVGKPFVTQRGLILSDLRAAKTRLSLEKDKREYNVIKKLEEYLSEGMELLHVPIKLESTNKKDSQQLIYQYNYGRYLLKVHNGTKEEFLSKAGVKKGFAREMFETIYDSIFAEADDVYSLYENFYSNEYQNLQHFLEMRYSLSPNIALKYANVCKSSIYRLIDFDAHSYGGNGVREFLMDNDLKERIYKWLNWEEYENQN